MGSAGRERKMPKGEALKKEARADPPVREVRGSELNSAHKEEKRREATCGDWTPGKRRLSERVKGMSHRDRMRLAYLPPVLQARFECSR